MFARGDADAESFAEMAAQLHEEPGVEDTIDLVLQYALKTVGCDYASVVFVTRRNHGRLKVETIAATDPVAAGLDALQLELGEGPDLEALSEDMTGFAIRDTATDDRWPRWAQHVASLGIRSMLVVRMRTVEHILGTLNLFGTQPAQFDADDLAVAKIMARHAAIAIGSARREENLNHAVDARKRIGQAQGILMERYKMDEDRAFQVLVRYSQDNNIKLHRVAEILVSTGSLPTSDATFGKN